MGAAPRQPAGDARVRDLGADEGSGLLPWSWARERLGASHDYWLATVGPDGRPHVTPVWGLWDDDGAVVELQPRARARRATWRRNPAAIATTDDPASPVVVEGVAARVTDAAAVGALRPPRNAKYDVTIPRRSSSRTPASGCGRPGCSRCAPTTSRAPDPLGLRTTASQGRPGRWSDPLWRPPTSSP